MKHGSSIPALIPQPQRLFPHSKTDAHSGSVRISWPKAVWFLGHLAIAVVFAVSTFSLGALGVFFALTGITLCCGHSVGMHRLLIHRSYRCPKWLEHLLVYLGVLVGMGGPFGMIYLHEIRDWAQKQPKSHAFFGHRKRWWTDAYWQLCCNIHLKVPPVFTPESAVADDRFYRFLQRTWMLQQLPWAVLLGLVGGIGWVIWGISLRIVVSLTGHWLIGHLAHNRGRRTWHIEGASVQGYNIPGCGVITMGEGWHNNHHAFPRSARYGLGRQCDPGWWFLLTLSKLGLVQNLQTPENLPPRPRRVVLSKGSHVNNRRAGFPTRR